jgi:hypothetical protein
LEKAKIVVLLSLLWVGLVQENRLSAKGFFKVVAPEIYDIITIACA